MKINQAGLDIIKRYEGYSATPYICPAGYPTIGYGHLIKKNEADLFKNGITKPEAENLLIIDCNKAQRSVANLITAPLNKNQFSALVSFVFNLGGGALQRSTLRQKLNRLEYEEIPNELIKWVYAGGKKLGGLIARRRAEAILFLIK